MLVDGDNIVWLGRAQGGARITTLDRLINVFDLEEIDPLPVSRVQALLPKRYRDSFPQWGPMTPGAGRAVLEALHHALPDYADLLNQLSLEVRPWVPSGARSDLLNQERDAVGLLLDVGGIGRAPLRSWTTPTADVPFLSGLPERGVIEDASIAHDVERFAGWAEVPSVRLEWHVFENARKRMFVMNANRTTVEKTLGVHVVYFNEARSSFVLVQYKKFRREGASGRLVYRPDKNLDTELQRMRQIDEQCNVRADGEFRLLPSPCWVKICLPQAVVRNPAELVGGMYLPRQYFEQALQVTVGRRGGRHISFDSQQRRIANTLFIDLLSDGWIGSCGSGSALVEKLVRSSLSNGRAVVFGAQLPPPITSTQEAASISGQSDSKPEPWDGDEAVPF
ncbi:hypothetical protein ABT235_12130 [Micromonospora echinofusca]|uniref:hypothetical protein n=1 Tax=Micromonospora echinofusca TaxID=47858 RepID=UPI0033202131